MNRKGQTLVAFVVIIPVFILLLAFVVDTGVILKEYTKSNNTTKTILKITHKYKNDLNYNERINELLNKNKIPTENLKIETIGNSIKITNEYKKESIFGKIIGLKDYSIKINMTATEENNQLIIDKE